MSGPTNGTSDRQETGTNEPSAALREERLAVGMPGGDDEISLGAIRLPQASQSTTQGEFFALRAGRVGDRDPKMLRHWSQDYIDAELEREGLDVDEVLDRKRNKHMREGRDGTDS